MAATTEISWAGGTWNPFFGCSRVGPGCDNCYAILEAHRKTANHKLPAYFQSGVTAPDKAGKIDWTGRIARNSDKVWRLPLDTKKPTIFFVNSMSDLFHENMTDEDILSVFKIMNDSPQHQFQVLTKRPNRMLRMSRDGLLRWTPNIWAGVTVEDNKYVGRVDLLRKVPARMRFISAEPLLSGLPDLNLDGIDLLIVGGESGPGARPMKPEWARDLRDACLERDLNGDKIVFHFKQWGLYGPDGVKRSKKENGHLLDGVVWHDLPDTTVESAHGARSKLEFVIELSKERRAAGYRTIMTDRDEVARIKLREVVLNTLDKRGSMEARELCAYNLSLVGLDAHSKAHVNIHAWALSDLVRNKIIGRVLVDTGRKNRRDNPIFEKHYRRIAA